MVLGKLLRLTQLPHLPAPIQPQKDVTLRQTEIQSYHFTQNKTTWDDQTSF